MFGLVTRWFRPRSRRGRRRPSAARPSRVRPRLEPLEDRLAPAVISVISTADNNNPVITAGHAGTAADPFLAPSLRSALSFANGNAGGNTINLSVAGAYKITLAGTAGETDNAAGEFAILPAGGNLTIVNASGGSVAVDGNHLNRVFDVNPGNTNNPATKILVTMQGFTIQNGIAQPGDLAAGSGGGIRDQGNASLTLNGMAITNNSATADGGGVSMENAPASTPWTLTVNNSIITGNHAGDAGGGLETDGTGKVFITGGQLSGNTCVNQGAAVWLDAIGVGSANLTMTNVLVAGNSALNGPTGAIGNAGNGAVTITNCTVENNSSGTTGGGFGDENNLGTLTVSGSLFQNNSALGNGGGIQEGGFSLVITGSVITGNSTNAAGGGVFANGITLNILNSTISNNTSAFTSAAAPHFGGGGLEVQTTGTGAGASSITNSTIVGNSVLNNAGGNNGGGIDASANFTGALTLLNDTITGDYADTGGGVFWAGTAGSIVTVQNTVIAANSASVAGPDADNAAGLFTDAGGNLIGISGAGSGNTGFNPAISQTGTVATPLAPKLGPLTLNGGPTAGAAGAPSPLLTEAPLAGGPLLLNGVAAGAPATDERGYLRPAAGSGKPTVGAVEFLTANERFVQAVYLDELGRPGTTAELDGWVSVLNSGGQNAVAGGILHSPEARDHLVKSWYVAYLGRQAQNGEEMWAVNELLAGQTEEQVLSVLLGSGEFFTHAQTLVSSGTPQQRVVTALYQLLLNRTPSPAELNAQVNSLAALGQQGLALAFLQSAEYRGDVVGGDYVTLLHRAADPVGVNAFVLSGMDLGAIRQAFEAGPEFFSNG